MLSRRDIEKELGKGINIEPIIRDSFKENSKVNRDIQIKVIIV